MHTIKLCKQIRRKEKLFFTVELSLINTLINILKSYKQDNTVRKLPFCTITIKTDEGKNQIVAKFTVEKIDEVQDIYIASNYLPQIYILIA